VGEDGGLIAGHARILAARQLGIGEIPVMVAAGWCEAQKRAYVLADPISRKLAGGFERALSPRVWRRTQALPVLRRAFSFRQV
jgi:ParB-like chromosome segregation protein Spo0J